MDLYYSNYCRSKNDAFPRSKVNCLGFSLFNLLVSMAISVIILLGAVQWYQVVKKQVLKQAQMTQDLVVGRTTLQFLINDINGGGYRGCRNKGSELPIRKQFGNFMDPMRFFRIDRAVFGFEVRPGSCEGRAPKKVCERAREDSQVLVIYNIPQNINALKDDMRHADDEIQTEEVHHIRKGSVVLISDCLKGDVFIANEIEPKKIYHQKTPHTNLTSHFSVAYKKGAEITELQTVAYYLAKPNRLRTEPNIFSLYRDNFFNKAEEILEGVIDFELEYVVLESSGSFKYQKASFIQDHEWKNVQAVRLRLKTLRNSIWEYEVAIRSWHGLSVNSNIANRYFFISGAFDESKHFNC